MTRCLTPGYVRGVSSARSTAAKPLPDPAWWAAGLALHERGVPAAGGEVETEPGFAARLADLGMPQDPRLGESPAELAARIRRPAWAVLVEDVLAAARPLPSDARPAADWREAFARVLAPFVDAALTQIRRHDGRHVDLDRVAATVGTTLGPRLVGIAARALVTELHRWRAEGRLAGGDSQARFHDFVRQLTAPTGLGEVLARYPVLARLLAQDTATTADATVELLDRFSLDRDALIATLLGGTDPGPVTSVLTSRGDRHAGGRSVAFVDFDDGRRIVYKPRDLAPHTQLTAILEYLSTATPGLFPRTPRTLARTGYGWAEHIAALPLFTWEDADLFYRRQGALLALLHLVRAADVHYENLVAHGDQPVLVDVETLFHPGLTPGGSGDPAADALAASVHRTALLPLVFVGEQGVADVSGLGGDPSASPSTVVDWLDAGTDRMRLTRRAADMAAAANRPILNGRLVEPHEHDRAIVGGFRHAYDTFIAHRDALTALVRDCADLEVRVVVRATWMYQTLLDETTHPDVLRDAVDRDRALSVLYHGRTEQPLLAQLLRPELAALWAGDIPMFTASVGTGRIRTTSGAEMPELLPQPGLAAALATLASLDEVSRRGQEWIISATLASRARVAPHPDAAPIAAQPEGAAAHPDELLAAACAVADQLVAEANAGGGRVNWLGLEAVEDHRWLVLPLGASLGSGYLGVALFLAQLAAVTGIYRYAEQARAATADLPQLVAALDKRPDLVAVIGCGGLDGLGGIAYGLARIGTLLDDSALTDAAARTVPLAMAAATPGASLGWSAGLAGCLAALTAVHTELKLPEAADAARRCADLLVAPLTESDGVPGLMYRTHHGVSTDRAGGAWPASGGFADGLAGVGWALTTIGPDDHHHAAGRRLATLLGDRGEQVAAGWCRGTAGAVLARTALSAATGPRSLAGCVETLANAPVRRDLSLCHGELGVTEVLAQLAGSDRRTLAAQALRRRAGLVLDVLRRHGSLCGVPGGARSPGLLTGLAGIGYGLLRHAAPQRVPSVLLLQHTMLAP